MRSRPRKPSSAALIAVFNPWQPEEGLNMLAFVLTLDNDCGDVPIESRNFSNEREAVIVSS
jgi:hypothetical protein